MNDKIREIFNELFSESIPIFYFDNYVNMTFFYNEKENTIECNCLFEKPVVSVDVDSNDITVGKLLSSIKELEEKTKQVYLNDYDIDLGSNLNDLIYSKHCDESNDIDFLWDVIFGNSVSYFGWSDYNDMRFFFNRKNNSIDCICVVDAPHISVKIDDENNEVDKSYLIDLIDELEMKIHEEYYSKYKIILSNDF